MKTPEPTVAEVVRALDHRNEAETASNQILLHRKYGLRALVPLYVAAYPMIKNWIGRKYIMFYLGRYAREVPDVVKVAREALNDKSWKVRHDAMKALAFAFDDQALPVLRHLLRSRNKETRDDAAAAIDAITNRNQHLFLDRRHEGNIRMEMGKLDDANEQ